MVKFSSGKLHWLQVLGVNLYSDGGKKLYDGCEEINKLLNRHFRTRHKYLKQLHSFYKLFDGFEKFEKCLGWEIHPPRLESLTHYRFRNALITLF